MSPDSILQQFVAFSQQTFADNLVGVYLHGSAAMGCYNPKKSDLDFIVVVRDSLTLEQKREFMEDLIPLHLKTPTKGIEMSVVKRSVCASFVYPTPFELHFSGGHLDWYQEDPEDYMRKMCGVDPDLAAHFTVILKRGICLFGTPIAEVFGPVPAADYLDSIRLDVADAREDIMVNPLYVTLNLARVLAFIEDGVVFSKKEGGIWALEHLPERYHAQVRKALQEYTEGAAVMYDAAESDAYAEYVLGLIDRGSKR